MPTPQEVEFSRMTFPGLAAQQFGEAWGRLSGEEPGASMRVIYDNLPGQSVASSSFCFIRLHQEFSQTFFMQKGGHKPSCLPDPLQEKDLCPEDMFHVKRLWGTKGSCLGVSWKVKNDDWTLVNFRS